MEENKVNMNITCSSGVVFSVTPKKKRKKFKDHPCEFSELEGQIIISVRVYSDKIVFVTDEYYEYTLKNENDISETKLESIKGDFNSLIGNKIGFAKEKVFYETTPDGISCDDGADSFTCSVYKLKTLSGKVKITFCNWSNEGFSSKINITKTTLKLNQNV